MVQRRLSVSPRSGPAAQQAPGAGTPINAGVDSANTISNGYGVFTDIRNRGDSWSPSYTYTRRLKAECRLPRSVHSDNYGSQVPGRSRRR